MANTTPDFLITVGADAGQVKSNVLENVNAAINAVNNDTTIKKINIDVNTESITNKIKDIFANLKIDNITIGKINGIDSISTAIEQSVNKIDLSGLSSQIAAILKQFEQINNSNVSTAGASTDNRVLQQSNEIVKEHVNNVEQAVHVEAKKATQSEKTAVSIKKESSAINEDTENLKEYIQVLNNLDINKTNVNESDVQKIAQLAQDTIDVEGKIYQLQKVSVDKVVDDEGISKVAGSLQYYNKELATTITQHYNAVKAEQADTEGVYELQIAHEKLNKTFATGSNISPEQYYARAEQAVKSLYATISKAGFNNEQVVPESVAKYLDLSTFKVDSNDSWKQVQFAIATVKESLASLRAAAKGDNSFDPLVTLQPKLDKIPTTLASIKLKLDGLSDTNIKIGDETVDLTDTYNALLNTCNKLQGIDLKSLSPDDAQKKLVEINQLLTSIRLLGSQTQYASRANKNGADKIVGGIKTQQSNYDSQAYKWDTDLSVMDSNREKVVQATQAVNVYKDALNNLKNSVKAYENVAANQNKTPEEMAKATAEVNRCAAAFSDAKVAAKNFMSEAAKDRAANISYNSVQQKLTSLINQYENFAISNSKYKNNAGLNAWYENDLAYLKDQVGNKNFDDAAIKRMQTSLHSLNIEARELGYTGKTFGQQIQEQMKKLSVYFSGAAILGGIAMQFKNMYTNVVKLDDAMTVLKKVTDESNTSYINFLDNATSRAVKLGAALSDVVTATSTFARMGYSLNESTGLADAALIAQNVWDNVGSIDETSNTIIATMKAFNIQANDAISIVDRINAVSNTQAVVSGDIANALSDSGSALAAAGNNLNDAIAMFTATNEITQDYSKTSAALRTISSRLRKTTGELEEMEIDSDGAAESITQLQQKLYKLSGVDIMSSNNEFKSTIQIVRELSQVWEDLTDVQQAEITSLISGTRQASTFNALVSNFATAEKVLTTAENAQGSAMTENEKVLESITGKLDILKATYESLSSAVMDSGFIKNIIDAGTQILSILTSIAKVSTPGLLGALTGGISSAAGLGYDSETFKAYRQTGTNTFGSIFAAFGFTGNKTDDDIKILNEMADSLNKCKDNGTDFATAMADIDVRSKAISKNNVGKITQIVNDKNVTTINEASSALRTYSAQLAASGVQAKLTTLKTQALNMAVNALTGIAIGIAIQVVTWGISELVNAQQNAIDKAKELTNQWKEQTKALKEANEFVKQNGDELVKLSTGVGRFGEQVGLTDEQYARYIELSSEALEYMPNLTKHYTEQGDAVLYLKDGYASLNAELEAKAQLDRDQRSVDFNDVYKGYKSDTNGWGYDTIAKITDIQNLLAARTKEEAYSYVLGRKSYDLNDIYKLLKSAGYNVSPNDEQSSGGRYLPDEYYDAIFGNPQLLQSYLNTLIESINYDGLRQRIQDALDEDVDFSALDNNLKSGFTSILHNLDYEFFNQDGFDKMSGTEFIEYIQQSILDPLTSGNTAEEVQNAIATILNPDNSLNAEAYSNALYNAFASLPEALQSIMQESLESSVLPDDYVKRIAEKLNLNIQAISRDDFTASEVRIILDPEFELKDGQSIQGAISEWLNTTDEQTTAIHSIDEAIDGYNEKIGYLNKLYSEQYINGKITSETYNDIKDNCEELVEALEIQRDELGNVTGYTLAEDKLKEYSEAQLEATVKTLRDNDAVAEQFARLNAYSGTLSSVTESIHNYADSNKELADAYVKTQHSEQFVLDDVIKFKEQYPELVFEIDKVTGKYNLYPESATKIMKANADMIKSLIEVKGQFIDLSAAINFQNGGWANGAEQVQTWKNRVNEMGVTSVGDYLEKAGIEHLNEYAQSYIEAYTSFLNEVNDLPNSDEIVANEIEDSESSYNGKDAETAFSKYKKQLDLEKSALEAEMKLDPDFVVYNLNVVSDYYYKLRELATNAYEAEEIDAIEYQQYLIEAFEGLKQTTVDKYAEQMTALETERSKHDAGMAWNTALFTNLSDYYDQIEVLNKKRYDQSLINQQDFVSKQVEIFNGRNDLLEKTFEDYERDITLWSNQDDDRTLGIPLNTDKIVERLRLMQDIAHQTADKYREEMSSVMTPEEIDNSSFVKGLQDKWWGWENDIQTQMENQFQRGFTAYQDYINNRNKFTSWGADSEIATWKRVERFLDSSYANGLIDYKTYLTERLSVLDSQYMAEQDRQQAYVDAMNGILDKEKESLEKQREKYEQQKTDYETTVSTVTNAIQERIDALQKEDEELNKQLELQKAIQAVEEARSQKNKRVYREGEGFVWEADADAVKDAQVSLDKLNKQNDLQNQIDALEAYKKAWQATVDDYQKNLDEHTTAMVLGENWEKDILNLRTNNMVEFANSYKNNCNQIDEKIEGTVAFQIKQLDDLAQKWTSSYDTINENFEQYDGLLTDMAAFENASYATRLALLDDFSSNSVDRLNNIRDAALESSNALADLNGFDVGGIKSIGQANESVLAQMQENATAWHYADDKSKKALAAQNQVLGNDLGLVYEESSGRWYFDKDKKIRAFSNGGVADYTGMAMLHGTKSAPELILNSSDTHKLYDIIHNGASLPASNMGINSNQPVSITIGDINVSEVENPDQLAKAIVNEFPNRIMQRIYKRS